MDFLQFGRLEQVLRQFLQLSIKASVTFGKMETGMSPME